MTKICFVSLYAYPLFNPENHTIFGGSEVRAKLFAEGLATYSDLEISFVVFDHGQASPERFGAITAWKHSHYRLVPRSYLNRRIRDLFSSNESKFRAYREAAADIYCVFGVSDFADELLGWCKENGKRFVLFAGSDSDFSESHSEASRVLKNADQIIVQTERQRQLLRQRFARDAFLIRNPIGLNDTNSPMGFEQRENLVVWVGKSDAIKRPEIFVELAKRIPEAKFTMVMNASNHTIHEQVTRGMPSNLNLVDRMPYAEIQMLLATSRAFVNTSIFEGFANTFLEAGKNGVPVFTLNADPDDFIAKNECGFSAHGDLANLVEKVRDCVRNEEVFKRYSRNVAEYVRLNHELGERVSELNSALKVGRCNSNHLTRHD